MGLSGGGDVVRHDSGLRFYLRAPSPLGSEGYYDAGAHIAPAFFLPVAPVQIGLAAKRGF